MEKIDLTKCNNCRFRAVVDGNKVAGRIEKSKLGFIVKGGEWFGCVISLGELDSLMRGERILLNNGNFYVVDFEIVPRDPETYQDWQVGDKLCEDEHEDTYCEVIFRSGEVVIVKYLNNYASDPMTCYEAFAKFGLRLVLTDIEKQIIEEKKKYEPQDGDICFVKTAAGNCFIFIKRDHKPDEEIHSYACFDTNLWTLCPAKVSCVCDRQSIRELRPATAEEEQLLFDAMSKQGKRWNAEKKVVEGIPKHYEFKKGDAVLVRDYGGFWEIRAFVRMRDEAGGWYTATSDGVDDCSFRECISYNERTMHLLGTAEDYKEE